MLLSDRRSYHIFVKGKNRDRHVSKFLQFAWYNSSFAYIISIYMNKVFNDIPAELVYYPTHIRIYKYIYSIKEISKYISSHSKGITIHTYTHTTHKINLLPYITLSTTFSINLKSCHLELTYLRACLFISFISFYFFLIYSILLFYFITIFTTI